MYTVVIGKTKKYCKNKSHKFLNRQGSKFTSTKCPF